MEIVLNNYKRVFRFYTYCSIYLDISVKDNEVVYDLFNKLKEDDIDIYEYLNIILDSMPNIIELKIIIYLPGIKIYIYNPKISRVVSLYSYLEVKIFTTTVEKIDNLLIERKIDYIEREEYVLDIIQTLNIIGIEQHKHELNQLILLLDVEYMKVTTSIISDLNVHDDE